MTEIVIVQLVVVVRHVFIGLFGVPDLILHQVIESPILDQHSIRKLNYYKGLLAIAEEPRNHTGWDEEHLLFGLLGQEFRGTGLKELED